MGRFHGIDLLGELGRRYRAYSELMCHWHSVLPSGVMLDVQYEDVVANPEAEARRIIRHCGLDWHPACLDFHNSPRPVRTASVVQVRQPIYQNAVGRWRLDANVVRPLLDGLGFEQAPATPVTPPPAASAGTASAAESAGRIAPLR